MADTGVASRLRSLTAQNVPGVAIARAGAEGCGKRRHAGYADLTALVVDDRRDPFLGGHCPAALEGRFVCGLAQPGGCGGC